VTAAADWMLKHGGELNLKSQIPNSNSKKIPN